MTDRLAAAQTAIDECLAKLRALNVRVYLVSAHGQVVWLTAPGKKFSIVTEPEKKR